MLASKQELLQAMKESGAQQPGNGTRASKEELLQAMQQSQQQPGFLGRVEQGAKDIFGGLARGIVDTPEEILESSPIPSILQKVAKAGGHPQIAAAAQPFSAIGEQLPGDPSDLLYKAGRYGPAIAGGVRGAFDLGRAGLQLGRAGVNQLSKRSQLISRALGKSVPQAEENLANYARKALSEDYYGDRFFHQNKLGDEQEMIRNDLRNNYQLHKGIAGEFFDRALEEGGDDLAFGVDNIKELKFLKKLNKNLGDSNLDKAIRTRIKDFKENPTNENLHWLKSSIGSKMRGMWSMPPAERDQSLIDNLENVYQGMNKKLTENLGDDYKFGVKYYKENVLPYLKDTTINKAVTKKDSVIGNLSNRLAKTTEGNEDLTEQNIDKIVYHMTPEQKDRVLLPHLQSAANTLGEVDGRKFLDNLLSLSNKKVRSFVDTNETMHINNLRELIRQIEKETEASAKIRKRIGTGVSAGTGAALGAAGILGLDRELGL